MRFVLVFMMIAQLAASAQQSFPVIEAVGKGHGVGQELAGVSAVEMALRAGGDVNEKDKAGWTPLLHAALECRPRIVKLLLERGADVNARALGERKSSFMDHGQSALTVAASCFIAQRRASIAPGRGMSAEYVRSELEAPLGIVQQLIARGAVVNHADADGRTPLMIAARHGWDTVVAALLAAKARVNARDAEGRLAVDYADPVGGTRILELLRKAGSEKPTGRSGRTVCDAERALDKLGYDTPIIDCIEGQQLSVKITKYQKDRNLPSTGVLDEPTKTALGIR